MESKVRIEELNPFRAASFHAYGSQPELEAIAKMETWVRAQGFSVPPAQRVFGFNNPNPSPGSPNYGYEIWITVGPQVQPVGEVEVVDYPGGLYAVLRWDGQGDPNEAIPAAWKELVVWREKSQYQSASHQWLEEHLKPEADSLVEFMLDLYLPIAKG